MGRRRAMGGASKSVAIKLLASHLARKPIYRRMFVDEARLTMMLTHSNIVQVFDVGEQGGRSYLVMEWIDGLDLSRLAQSMRERGEAFGFAVIAHVIGEVLRGLAYAHDLRDGEACSAIVHRDISPHNVLISVSGEVKISDFGVARLASEETSGVHVRGKLRYMPPEQLRGMSKHATIDLFAVGAMLQELLDGTRFRAGLERDELFGMVIAGEVPPLERRGVPPVLVALRDGLLQPRREDRIPSAREALELLRSWSGYRNATDDLAELVRGRAGITAPRTGLTLEVSDDLLEPSEEPTVQELNRAAQGDSSSLVTRTRRSVSADVSGSETTPTPVPRGRPASGSVPAPAKWRALAGGIVLGVAVLAGFGVASFSRAATPELGVQQAEAEWGEGEGAGIEHVSVAASVVEAEPAEPEPSPAEPEPAAEEPEPAPELTAERGPRVAAKAPAKVEFAAHEFFFVWVKVAGKQRALEPHAALNLPAGRHKVWIREAKSEPWRAAGHIKIAPGESYRVSLRRPAGLELERE